MTLIEQFRSTPNLRELVQYVIEEHAPNPPTREPVTLPRPAFVALCLAALVGLEASENSLENPMQPFIKEGEIIRFKANKIVDYLLDNGGIDMNKIASLPFFSQDDRCQFYQLIGYSLCGYHELHYVSDEHAKGATAAARIAFPEIAGLGGCRDEGCEIHCGVEKEKP